MKDLSDHIKSNLSEIQVQLYAKAKKSLDANINPADDWESFESALDKGGFVSAHWDGTSETENKIKEMTKATIRCITEDPSTEEGKCVYSEKPAKTRVLFAKAY